MTMTKKARERKRLIRILKSEGLQTDPKSVKEWHRKILSLYWQDVIESRVISRFKRQKRRIMFFRGLASGGFTHFKQPGVWEPQSLYAPGAYVSGASLCYRSCEYGKET